MAVATVTNLAINDLPIVDFFDPDAEFNTGTSTRLSLVSRDGYELVFRGADFDFDAQDRPTDGTVTDVFLYDPDGDLVGRIDDVSFSLEDYYDTVAVDGQSGAFTADLLSGDDDINGGSARDRLVGYAGNDDISGGSGADTLSGDGGADTIDGGSGDDDIEGGAGNDRLLGGSGFDLIHGDAGNDSAFGGEGRDRLFGESGKDVLRGQAGDDSLAGGAGDDTLVGGGGRDVLQGGSGADQFRFEQSGEGPDVALDFIRGEDLLVFDDAGFQNLDASFDLVVNNNPKPTDGDETFLFDADSHRLFYDSNGDAAGGRELIAVLDNVDTLTKADFLIV